MPIPYNKLTYKDILHHQAAYDCFDKAGKQLFPEKWDIIGLEKAVLGCGDSYYLYLAYKIRETPNLFGDLDQEMPFLRYREQGQHYGYELFLSPPRHWMSRGAPLWWAYAARKLTYEKLPMDEADFQGKYMSIAKEFGLNIKNNGQKHIERFSAGGMSSGIVCEQFVREGWYDVRRRNRLYQRKIPAADNLYLEKAKERIIHYLNQMNDCMYELNPNVKSLDFQAAFEDAEMTDHQREVVSTLWGIYTGEPVTIREMAEKLGVSHIRIKQIENRCIQHLLSNKNRSDLIKRKEERPPELK